MYNYANQFGYSPSNSQQQQKQQQPQQNKLEQSSPSAASSTSSAARKDNQSVAQRSKPTQLQQRQHRQLQQQRNQYGENLSPGRDTNLSPERESSQPLRTGTSRVFLQESPGAKDYQAREEDLSSLTDVELELPQHTSTQRSFSERWEILKANISGLFKRKPKFYQPRTVLVGGDSKNVAPSNAEYATNVAMPGSHQPKRSRFAKKQKYKEYQHSIHSSSLFGSDPEPWRKNRKGQNAVRNQKYTIFSFLPLVLFEQFSMFYNLFFLVIALTQFIPALRVGLIWSYIAPLLFVVSVSTLKEGIDDYQRYKRDSEVNALEYTMLLRTVESEPTYISAENADPNNTDYIQQENSTAVTVDLNNDIPQAPLSLGSVDDLPVLSSPVGPNSSRNNDFVTVSVQSRDILPGDILLLDSDQRVPADVLLLKAYPSDGKGDSIFIRTDQLDGETDWKLRRAVHTTQTLPNEGAILKTRDSVYTEAPRKEIYDYIGNYQKMNGEIESLSLENVLWSNTVVASGKALVMVLYIGKEQRFAMNASMPRSKVGLLEYEVNFLSKLLFGILFLFAFILTALRGFYGQWYLYFFRYFLLLSYIIPISLRINLDMAKIVYSYFIESDTQRMPESIVRSSDIPEELGRVSFLLSDKTGTLTQNEMEFKKLHLGSILFSKESIEDMLSYLNSAFGADNMDRELIADPSVSVNKSHRRIETHLREAILAISIAHNVTPVEENNVRTYEAASPDEVALIKYVESLGVLLEERSATEIRIRAPSGEIFMYDILVEFPFTSEAKRMGIVVRERETGITTMYTKGADSVMSKMVRYNDWLDEECGNLARDGLRTLVFGKKVIDNNDFEDFLESWHNAKTQQSNRKEAMAAAQGTLERDLELLALTGVEDKLQPSVRETLEKLRHAGIKIWMLTGDKVETATCIAVSSRLAERTQGIFNIVGIDSRGEAAKKLARFKRVAKTDVLVIDGTSLQVFLDHFPEEFVEVVCISPAVVASRCSPTQKADVAKVLQKYTKKRVAAIGDGGNDVSMIQRADVGIGIPGKEGKQASLAADFSIKTFSYLTRLLLWHGRNSYKRSARLAQFVVHRGLIITVIQMVYSALFFYAAVSVYDSWILVGYATIFTMLPVFSLVLDEDVSAQIADTYPELYKDLQKGRALNIRTFLVWVFKSVYQGTIIMVFSVYVLWDDSLFTTLHLSAISFTSLILTELIMVCLEIHTWHWAMIVAQVLSMLFYALSLVFLDETFDHSVISTWGFWWKVIVVTLVSCLPVTLGKFLKRKFAPPPYAKLV